LFSASASRRSLVRAHAGPYGSYAGQAAFSIELSYLLNRWITWRDRQVGLWSSWWRFNAQKTVLTVPNLALYAAGIQLGTGWLAANLGTTAVFTVVNYLTGDLWSFAAGGATRLREAVLPVPVVPAVTTPLPSLPALSVLPTVSVVIPCKSSERTIRATVVALLAQDYPELVEVICVGDVDDSTWLALADIADPRLIILEQPKSPGRRDPNVKRDRGIRHATGEVLALADSDIVMEPGWLSAAIRLLCSQGRGLVAGGMRSIHDTFWGRFVDRNALAAKTPRIAQPYQVTAANFGKHGFKPPVTANAVFTRDLYQECPLDVTWSYGYEDYEWFWRVAREGHEILFSRELTAAHHHRRSFRRLAREYRQASDGCAYFVQAHPDSPLARKRLLQAILLPLAGLAALAAAGLAVADGHGLVVAAIAGIAAILLAVRETIAARSAEGMIYPPATLALGLVFTLNLARSLLRAGGEEKTLRKERASTARAGTGENASA
jgi:GT2 family glycosyltransferase/putative flippase GtrA